MVDSLMLALALSLAPAASPETTFTAPHAATEVATSPPSWIGRKPTLTPDQLRKKEEGFYVTGLPLANYDPDKGTGYGARLYLYHNGEKSNPLFRYTPYFHRIYLQFFQTTNGFRSHAIKWDAPYIAGSRYRVRAAIAYERDTDANYFGVGSETVGPLQRSDQTTSFDKIDDYIDENREIENGQTFARYNETDVLRPRANIHLERDFFGGVIRPLIGFQAAKAYVFDYAGKTVTVDGEKAVNVATKLQEDASAGKILGFDGGWVNTAKLGVAYDTRDYEPNPLNGAFHDITFEISDQALGSDFDFRRTNTALRYYWSPISKTTTLTLAGRALYQVQAGDVPFFEMATLAFTQGNDFGLGGLRSIRGYKENRFVGPVAALGNLEARWTFFEHVPWGQRFGYMLSPFFDAGRVFDHVDETSFQDWKLGYGAGVRVIWNLATILAVDYGISEEGSGIYINFQLMF